MKICPKFQVISFHFFEFSTSIYVECYEIHRWSIKGLHSRFRVNSVWPWCSTWKIKVQQPCLQKNWLKVAKFKKSYTVYFPHLIRICGFVVWASSRESGDMGSIPDECWFLLQRLCHVVWHWAHQCFDMRSFYIAALSILFFSWISSVAISRKSIWFTKSVILTWWLLIFRCSRCGCWYEDLCILLTDCSANAFQMDSSLGGEGWKTLTIGHCFFCIFEDLRKNTGPAFSGLSAPLSRAQQPQISQYLDATLWRFNWALKYQFESLRSAQFHFRAS